MSTRALDIITILKCVEEVEEILKAGFVPMNKDHERILVFWHKFKYLLKKITNLKSKHSGSADVLNNFLTEHGFNPMFTEISGNEFGVVAILDKLVSWINVLQKTSIRTQEGGKPGVIFPEGNFTVYNVNGYPESRLIQLFTSDDSEDYLWLFSHNDRSLAGLDLVELSFDVMESYSNGNVRSIRCPKVVVPMIKFDVNPDISFLKGMTCGKYHIGEAIQQFKFALNEVGAHVKVATGLVMRGISFEKPLVIDQPFYGWFTQKSVIANVPLSLTLLDRLPIASFFADWDCWTDPRGLNL